MVPWLILASSLFSAASEKEAGKKNAAAARRNAAFGRTTDLLRERGMRLQQDSALSKIRANAGAAGVDISRGSAMQVYLQTARETELEIAMAHKTAEANFDARISGAADAEAAGGNRALGSLLSGAADLYKYKAKKDEVTYKESGTGTLTKPGDLSVPSGYRWGG